MAIEETTQKEQVRRKPGPAPLPSSPYSRHNPVGNKVNRGIRHKNEVGGACSQGHLLEGKSVYVAKNGKVICRVCMQNRRRDKVGLPPLDHIYDRRQDQEKRTHCKQGHEYVDGSYYVSTDRNGYMQRQCKRCNQLSALKRRYGLSEDQYQELLASQGGHCGA